MRYKRTGAVLPAALQPYRSSGLIRFGQGNDGGYLVESLDVCKSDCLISLGISNDWSFEKDFCARNDCPVFAYDGSISANHFLKNAIKTARFPSRWRAAGDLFGTWRDYRAFFRGKRRHFEKFVGLPSHGSVTLDAIVDQIRRESLNQPFLKIDIEGSEYRIMDELLAAGNITTGLAIEIHDCDLHITRIVDFVNAYPLALVHIHANNFSPISEEGIPLSLELTFSSSCNSTEKAELPNPLDLPNKATVADYELSFSH